MIWGCSYFRKAPMKPTISVHVEHKPPVMAKYHQVPVTYDPMFGSSAKHRESISM